MIHRIAIVTGASSGLGKAISAAIHDDFDYVIDWSLTGGVDVSDEIIVTRAAASIARRYGHVDLLINCDGNLSLLTKHLSKILHGATILNISDAPQIIKVQDATCFAICLNGNVEVYADVLAKLVAFLVQSKERHKFLQGCLIQYGAA